MEIVHDGVQIETMSAKEILLEVAKKLPPDATISDAIYELEFRQAVAQAYDRLFVTSAESAGWKYTLREMADRLEVNQPAFSARVLAKGLIEQGRFSMAARADSDAAEMRNLLRKELTPKQFTDAQKRMKELRWQIAAKSKPSPP